MSDREIPEDDVMSWLDRQVPESPSPEVDQRILAAGAQLLEQRQRRWRAPLVAAAAIVVLVLGGWILRESLQQAPTPAPQVLAAAGQGSFTVSKDTRYQFVLHTTQLQLEAGACTVEAVNAPLETAFPGGRLRLERGHGEVEVLQEQDEIMERYGKKWKSGTLVVALSVVVGLGLLEFGDERHELEAGEQFVLRVEHTGVTPRPYEVTPLITNGESTPEGLVTDATDETPKFRGRVVDAESGAPVTGAKVGWVAKWKGRGPENLIARHSNTNTIMVVRGSPTGMVIGDHVVQLPFLPSADLEYVATTTTDESGGYELPAAEADTHFVVVTTPEYQPGYVRQTAEGSELALERQRIVRGRFVDSRGAVPIGEAGFASGSGSFALPSASSWEGEVRFDLDNEFEFELELGQVATLDVELQAQGYQPFEQQVALQPGINEVIFHLENHDHIQGRVTNEAGEPLQGVNLLIESGTRKLLWDDLKEIVVTTNSNGEFLSNIYGPKLHVSAEHSGYQKQRLRNIEISSPVDLILIPVENGSLRGIVEDEVGKPLPGVTVTARRSGVTMNSSYSVLTDQNGRFEILDLAPDSYELSAYPPVDGASVRDTELREVVGAIHAGTEALAVQVEPGEPKVEHAITVVERARIFGTYRDESGAAKAEERVALYKPDLAGSNHKSVAYVHTDANGRFAFHGVPEGLFAVAIPASGGFQLVRVSRKGSHEVNLGGKSASLTGRIFRANEPVANAAIAIGRLQQSGIETQRGWADNDGNFELEGLSQGRYLVHVRDSESGATFISVIELDRVDNELELDWPTTQVKVVLTGEPVPAGTSLALSLQQFEGITLGDLVPAEYLLVAQATTTDGVHFTFDGIAPGEYQITSMAAAERTIQVDVKVAQRDVTVETK